MQAGIATIDLYLYLSAEKIVYREHKEKIGIQSQLKMDIDCRNALCFGLPGVEESCAQPQPPLNTTVTANRRHYRRIGSRLAQPF